MLKKFLLLLLLPSVFSGQIKSLPESWRNNKDLKSASIGFCVMDASTSSVIAEYNSHQFLIPASTLKVLTTSAALGILGNTFRYETKIAYSGTLDKATGVLNGDLVILGSGDPTLQSEYFLRDSVPITDTWAKILKQKGIREIKGKIIGDASVFEHKVPSTWIWGDIGNYFGTVPCGLSYCDNKFKLIYDTRQAGSMTDAPKIKTRYFSHSLSITSSVVARGSEDEAYVYGDPFSYEKTVIGSLPPNKKNYEVEAALPDPALLCAEALYTSLTEAGIICEKRKVKSEYYKSIVSASLQTLHIHTSPMLDNIVLYTNLKSNNMYCESLVLTLGNGSRDAGIEAIKNYWQKRGMDISELFMSDGSGLSRANSITTFFQCQVLAKMYRDSLHFRAFNASLPVAGKSGSMSNIGKETYIEANLRAKTGYINRARGYCGYLTTKNGKEIAFSILFNNYNCSAKEAKLELEKFMVALADL